MRIALVIALLVGCGAAQQTTSITGAPVVPDQAEVVDGLILVRMSRPTSGLVRATLVIDAGSRDAEPPALATLAAQIAAAGTGATARVTPDSTEFRAECDATDLSACLAPLVQVMQRGTDIDEHAEQVAALRARRRNALAQPARRAITLAVIAAFEDESLDPLHFEADDDLGIEAVDAFVARHYGRTRALLQLEGDLSDDRVERGFADSLPTASEERAPRTARSGWSVSAEPGTSEHIAVALRVGTASRARQVAEHLASLDFAPHLFRLRGGAMVVVPTPMNRVAELVQQGHTAGGQGERPWPMDPVDRWLFGGEPPAESERVGVGAVCADGAQSDWEAARDRVTASVERGLSARDPALEGDIAEGGADVTLANGARILVRRQPGEVGVVVAFHGGAAWDPPAQHGRTAIAARALAERCRGAEGFVRADVFGLRVTSPDAAGLRQWIRCATRALDRTGWSRARSRVRADVAEQPDRAWAASSIAPAAPGWVATGGSLDGVSGARLGEWLSDARSGSRTRVVVVGDVDIATTVQEVAAALVLLPAGQAAPSVDVGPAGGALIPEDREGEAHRVVVSWRSAGRSEVAATAFARSVAASLAGRGLSIRWHDGGAMGNDAYASVALDLDDAALESLPQALAEAARAPVDLEGEFRRARWSLHDAVEAAEHLARTGATDVPGPESSTVDALRDAEPLYVVGRPQPEAAFRRHTRTR